MTALTELALQYGDYRAYGYRVERYDARTWILRDSTGAQLMVANYGGLSPTRGAAELEAYARIALAHHRATPCERAGGIPAEWTHA